MKLFFPNKTFSLIFISLICLSLSDNKKTLQKMELKQKIKGKMTENESREYFELVLPKDVSPGSLLVFTVKESRKGIREGEEIFSDPDIYVSKTKMFPSNREESDWYSERYGNDILTIPSYAVRSEEKFYVCMYCQYKCRYELNSYLSKEAQAELGKYYNVKLTKKSSLSFALYVPENKNKEELNVLATNPSIKNFRIFMAKESPSSQNTFQIIPSWIGGYAISVARHNKDYCTDCTYHILFQTEEEEVNIQFTAYFQSTLTKITSGSPSNDMVKAGSKRCYYFDCGFFYSILNSQLVINTNLYSGSVILKISGWKPKDEDKVFSLDSNEPYSYHIENDKSILIKKEDFETFDKMGSNEEYGKKLHFCIHGQQISSFAVNAYFLSEAQNLQQYNFISPGSEFTGFLQGGQVTTYKLLDFNLNKNSIITITFNELNGQVDFYQDFCTTNCKYDNNVLKERIKSGAITLAKEVSSNTKNIIINPEDNKCYSINERDFNSCKTMIVVKCLGTSSDICSFKILPTISDQPIMMSPKKTYYNIIAKGKNDLYEIVDYDETINSIVIVLTSVTGDAELSVEKTDGNEGETKFQGKVSRNKDYIPDVIRITPQILGGKSIVGKYQVKVLASSFSSYNLYYYTTRLRSKDDKPNINDITLTLSNGNIIKDYFPNDIDFKIYSYISPPGEKQDIKIVLSRINVHFSFKVYLDFNKIRYNYEASSKYQERLVGYEWASDHNNEVTISKTDSKNKPNTQYFIVVTKDESYLDEEKEELDSNSLMSYFIGVTLRNVPFTLNEGIEHSETLSDTYDSQNYFYIHNNINEPLNLEVNILNGEVDIFIDTQELTKENFTQIYSILDQGGLNEDNILKDSAYLSINNYESIELFFDFFNKKCKKKENTDADDKSCALYIHVVQSRTSKKYQKDSQYIITAKSSLNSATVLLSGKVYNVISNANDTDHYIIEEVKHRKGTSIYIKFKNGAGQIYARIPKEDEINTDPKYPNETFYDYKGVDTYMGKILSLPPKVFDRINIDSLKVQILLTVTISEEYGEGENVEYSLTYGTEPKRISQNVPYQSFLAAGEHHYFTFYFDKSTENIYISLSNMNGDADMYLKYGNDNLPTANDFDWSSSNLGHEYIDISKADKFFKKSKKTISGYYTLLVVGFTETTYTLYVSSHPDKIFPLVDNIPVSCKCQVQGSKCYFRYNNVYNSVSEDDKSIKKNEIIFTTQYIYGNGKMYASIYKDQELSSNIRKKYQEYFPSKNKFQFSNLEHGKRNYLKVTAEGQNYSKDSLILLTFECMEKTDVEITSASLQYYPLYSYIDPNRENMFYIKYNESLSASKQEESTINFYSSTEEDLLYEFHAYIGKARVKIFTNESQYNDKNEFIGYDYNHIAEFNIRADYDEEFGSIKTYTEEYFNSIPSSMIYNKNIYFSIKPMSDFGFYTQVNYDRSWINVPIGDTKTYLITNNAMTGYFDIHEDYFNVEMSIFLEKYIKKKAICYVKIVVLSKNARQISALNEESKLYHYEIPSKDNFDYRGKTDDVLGALSININNLPIIKEDEKDYKFIRALFSIEVVKNKQTKKIEDSTTPMSRYSELDLESLFNPQSKVTITITAGANNFKRIDLPQRTYYFSNTSLLQNSQNTYSDSSKKYDGNKEVKIFSLDKRSNADKKMIIELHTCSGKVDLKLTNKIVDYDNNPNDIPMKRYTDQYGKSRYLVDAEKDKHLYLSIKSAQRDDCFTEHTITSHFLCDKQLTYLLYYYSISDKTYTSGVSNLKLSYKYVKGDHSKIKISFYPLTSIFFSNKDNKFIEYNLFWTRNSTVRDKLDNICYLSQILNKNDGNYSFEYTQNNETIHVQRNIEVDFKNEYILEGLTSSESIYFNILARNLETNELIAYFPVKGKTEKKGSVLLKLLISFLVMVLLIFVAYATYSFCIARAAGYEDLRNPKSEIEMKDLRGKTGGYQRINL